MKKLLPLLFLLAFCLPAYAQHSTSTARRIVKYTSAPFTCDSAHEGWAYQDTTAHAAYFCNGTGWTATGGAPGGSTTQLQRNNAGAFGGISGATSNGTNVTFGSGNLLATSPVFTTDITTPIVKSAAGSDVAVNATAPVATTGASQAGKAASLSASAAVASTDTAGAAAGGSVTIAGGAAARNASGNANGGDVTLTPGTGIGTGTAGQVKVGTDGTSAAPAFVFASATTTGFYNSSGRWAFVSGGNETVALKNLQVTAASNATIGFASGSGSGSTLQNNATYFGFGTTKVVAIGDTTTGQTFSSKPTTPTQITANQNDYNPGGTSMYLRLSTDASRNVTGLTFTAAQIDGQTHVIINVGAQPVVLVNESASSTAANRFHTTTGADITLSADQEASVWYDGTTARWRVSKRN